MHIRLATGDDSSAIRNLHLQTFPEEAEAVSRLALELLSEQTNPETICAVAEDAGSVVGYVAFSPVTFENGSDQQGYTLAPLAVLPGHQGRGIGKALVRHGISQLTQDGVTVLFVYGDPRYYVRFGFSQETADPYTPPYPLKFPHGWMAMFLDDHTPPESPVAITCVPSLCRPELW